MRDEKEGRKKQARSNKQQQGKATHVYIIHLHIYLTVCIYLNESAKVLHQLLFAVHNVRAGLLERQYLFTPVQLTLLHIHVHASTVHDCAHVHASTVHACAHVHASTVHDCAHVHASTVHACAHVHVHASEEQLWRAQESRYPHSRFLHCTCKCKAYNPVHVSPIQGSSSVFFKHCLLPCLALLFYCHVYIIISTCIYLHAV